MLPLAHKNIIAQLRRACVGLFRILPVKSAKKQGKDYHIWAVEQGQIEDEVGNFDVLLLGPQVRHILRRVTAIVGDRAPVAVIEPTAYGRCDGAAVLRQAESLVNGR